MATPAASGIILETYAFETIRTIASNRIGLHGRGRKEKSGVPFRKGFHPAMFRLCDCFNPTTSWLQTVIRFNQKLKTTLKRKKNFVDTPARVQVTEHQNPIRGSQTTRKNA
jgi:hypothetical protein